MNQTRRGFLGALLAAVAGAAVAPFAELLPPPTAAPIRDAVALRSPCSTWSNLDTAAPLTQASLRQAMAMLEETQPIDLPVFGRWPVVVDPAEARRLMGRLY